MGKPLTLLFDPFESIVLFLAVLTVAFCINDGRSNWLEGLILMSLYVILVSVILVPSFVAIPFSKPLSCRARPSGGTPRLSSRAKQQMNLNFPLSFLPLPTTHTVDDGASFGVIHVMPKSRHLSLTRALSLK